MLTKFVLHTSGGLLELLTLLLPPLPRLQQTAQSGKFAPITNRWCVSAGEQGFRTHGGQSLYFISCKEEKETVCLGDKARMIS